MARLGRAYPKQPVARTRVYGYVSQTVSLAGTLSSGPALTAALSHAELEAGVLSSSPGLTAALTHNLTLAGFLSSSPSLGATPSLTNPIAGALADSPGIAAKLYAGPLLQSGYADTGATPASTLSYTLPNSVQVGSLLVAVVAVWTGATLTSVDDNNSNGTYSAATSITDTDGKIYVQYVPNAHAGSTTVTAHLSGSDLAVMAVLEYRHMTTSPFDVAATGENTSGSTDHLTVTTAATAQAQEIVLAIAEDGGASKTYDAGSSYDQHISVANGSNSLNLAVFDQSVSTQGTQSATLTRGSAHTFNAALTTFKSASGAVQIAGTLSSSPGIVFAMGHALPVLPLAAAPSITGALSHTVPVAGTLSDSQGITAALTIAGSGMAGTLSSSPGINASLAKTVHEAGTVTSSGQIAASVLHSLSTGGVLSDTPGITTTLSRTYVATLPSGAGLRTSLSAVRNLSAVLNSSAQIQAMLLGQRYGIEPFPVHMSHAVRPRQHQHVKVP